jgi:uncharacterized protein (DUF1778 family)
VITHACIAAQRVLANRNVFELDDKAIAAWESLNSRRPRDLAGLPRLIEHPSPFSE